MPDAHLFSHSPWSISAMRRQSLLHDCLHMERWSAQLWVCHATMNEHTGIGNLQLYGAMFMPPELWGLRKMWRHTLDLQTAFLSLRPSEDEPNSPPRIFPGEHASVSSGYMSAYWPASFGRIYQTQVHLLRLNSLMKFHTWICSLFLCHSASQDENLLVWPHHAPCTIIFTHRENNQIKVTF